MAIVNKDVAISVMRDSSRFEDEGSLKDFLANRLYYGCLSIVLGAGVSFGFGLPGWDDLIERAFRATDQKLPKVISNEDASELLLNEVCGNDAIQFAKIIRKALYQGCDLSFDKIRKNDLLTSIGAIVMASRRGNVSQIISYNFDDLLELYLNYHGFDISSISVVPAWSVRSDVRIYHPHGVLPSDGKEEIKNGIVFAQIQFDKVIGKNENVWQQIELNILRSNTCLFLGLSGNDKRLSSMLADVMDTHACKQSRIPFWGVSFSDNKYDTKKSFWESRGIYQKTLSSYNQLPIWLFDICQRAAQLHRANQ